MSPLSCANVEARVELYAADECDPAEADAIRRHLAHCPQCAAAHEEARQLVGLLELRCREPEMLRRLETRLAAEDQPRRRAVLRFPAALRRVAALAAMLLLTAGPVGWLAPGLQLVENDGGLVVALREEKGRHGPEAMLAPALVRGGPDEAAPYTREQLQFAAAKGRLPPPPAVDVALELRNTTGDSMQVWVAGPRTELRLDLRGPGAVSLPARDAAEPEPRAVTLRPGESTVVRIDRLTDGPAGARRSWYWTEPGDYTMTARFTTVATVPGAGERRVTARSAPVTIHVGGP